MPDWNTRLEVRLGGSVVAPISQFTPTFNVPHTVIHSIEADNVGYVRQPQTFTFTMTVQAIGTAVADLTALAVAGQEFEIERVNRGEYRLVRRAATNDGVVDWLLACPAKGFFVPIESESTDTL